MNLTSNSFEESRKLQEEIIPIAQRIFGTSFNYTRPNVYIDGLHTVFNGIVLQISDYAALTLDQLVELSEAVGTKLIDIKYSVEEGDYSEYTPGEPSSFVIIIREH
jgi:hypothetical protein